MKIRKTRVKNVQVDTSAAIPTGTVCSKAARRRRSSGGGSNQIAIVRSTELSTAMAERQTDMDRVMDIVGRLLHETATLKEVVQGQAVKIEALKRSARAQLGTYARQTAGTHLPMRLIRTPNHWHRSDVS